MSVPRSASGQSMVDVTTVHSDLTPAEMESHDSTDHQSAEYMTAPFVRASQLRKSGYSVSDIHMLLLKEGHPSEAIHETLARHICPDAADEDAKFKPDADANPKTGEPLAYYDNGRRLYLVKNAREVFATQTEGQFKRFLRSRGISCKCPDGLLTSPADDVLLSIQHRHDVDYAGALAGATVGVHESDGQRILVTSEPRVPIAEPGEWPTLRAIIEGLLGDDVQVAHFKAWLKIAYRAVRSGMRQPGQALVLAGPIRIGKSLLQAIITFCLGGRCASPYQSMTGGTAFNADLFGAEHLVIEDEVPSTDIKARRAFGSQIKAVTVNQAQRCHAKGRTPIMLRPFWRLSISLNDEPEDLMVLPPLDASLEDKLMILKCQRFPFPKPTETPAQQTELWSALCSEVPAMLHELIEWEIPSEMRSDRFGVKHYHHPEIIESLCDLSPEGKLLEMIDEYLLCDKPVWEGSATDLERTLTGPDSRCSNQAKRILHWSTAYGVYLSRLAKRMPKRCEQGRSGTKGRYWRIYAESESSK